MPLWENVYLMINNKAILNSPTTHRQDNIERVSHCPQANARIRESFIKYMALCEKYRNYLDPWRRIKNNLGSITCIFAFIAQYSDLRLTNTYISKENVNFGKKSFSISCVNWYFYAWFLEFTFRSKLKTRPLF